MIRRGNVFKLKEGGFSLDIMKELFTVRVVKPWNWLPRDVMAAPCDGWKHLRSCWMELWAPSPSPYSLKAGWTKYDL